jgi:HSP20 family protein
LLRFQESINTNGMEQKKKTTTNTKEMIITTMTALPRARLLRPGALLSQFNQTPSRSVLPFFSPSVRFFTSEAGQQSNETTVQGTNEGQQVERRGRRRRRGGFDDFDFFENDPFFRAFDRSLPSIFKGGRSELSDSGVWAPSVDISEGKDSYSVHAELPGLKKEDVTIKIDGDVLSIQGERKIETEKGERNYHRVERSYGSFVRSFQLPDNIDSDHVKASFNNGVLEVSVPKTEPKAKGRTISIDEPAPSSSQIGTA